ncbi:MAG: N-acetyl-gamma-glutamyl-phosphate reductase [Candidatus Omnitrophica bacterium]|nr:N-acetyl-gamma-glutamyl-phosphate reductase [Candidatus Omnitrophota bacterium]MBU3933790.1 N-acetyl-gamma-glutamyl-phosphate reductase [Candidatus Omnitrophota bacterium]
MVKVAIVGATGYAGEELLKILIGHPRVEIVSLSAKIDKPQKISQIFPELSGKTDLICEEPDFSKIVPDCDLAFLALPHRVSMEAAPEFLRAGKKVIDLSADYRLKDVSVYEQWYGLKHKNPEYLARAVYGLPEVYREKIKPAQLIANPGCYPTGIILGCLPFLAKGKVSSQNIIVDAKTGLSGAGREKEAALVAEMENNFRAYKVDAHQHAPEVNQELSAFAGERIEITFTPHLIPIQRGILSAIYLQLKKALSQEEAQGLYQDFYKDEPFVKVLPEGKFPQLKDVAKTNFCHIGLKISPAKKIAIVICAIDNLVKGASGQAVQNMNIMCGFEETEGLR